MPPSNDKPRRNLEGSGDSEARAALPIVAKLGAELTGIPYVGPLASAVIDLFQERKERAREAMQRENDARLERFFAEMLRADSSTDEKVADVMMDDADFHALLRACVADIEGEKVGAYAMLARRIASGKVQQAWRRHFILSLRDFSNAELDLLRQAYVAKRHDMMDRHGTSNSLQETAVLAAGEPGTHQAILMNNLVTRGFSHEGRISQIGEAFTTACWRDDQLTPEAIGRRSWTGHHVPILNYEIGNGTVDDLAIALQEALLHDGVKSSIVAVISDQSVRHFRMTSAMAILLMGGHSRHLQDNLHHLSSLASKVPLLFVQTTEAVEPMPGLTPFGTVACSGRPQADIVNEVREKLMAKSFGLG